MDRIYLDNNATTPVHPLVLEAMLPYFKNEFGNASSQHQFGLSTKGIIEKERESVAKLIGADSQEIIFTSGATESINLALKGFVLANQHRGNHIITIETEHKAVIDTCKYLKTIGFDITFLPVNRDGLIDVNDFKKALQSNTILVSVMLVNNEIGVLQPLREIANLTHKNGTILFTDATQAVGKIPVNVEELGIDMMAFSGHKFYAPKGVGGLYVRELKNNKIKLNALIHGGGHESGLRSGTLNVPAIVGLGKASEIANNEMITDAKKISVLRDKLEKELLKFSNSFVNGSIDKRIYNVSNICFPGIDANIMIGKMKDIAVSNGSACSSAIIEPSHVLKAIGLSNENAFSSIRFSLGKFNTEDQVDSAVKIITELVSNISLKYA